MQNAHFSALTAKHHSLDERIASESQRPLPDQMLLAELDLALTLAGYPDPGSLSPDVLQRW